MDKQNKFRFLLLFFAIIGPGIITSTVDNDASGIATYSIAGAQFGYALIWTLIPITILLFIIQEMVARMGVVTGKGLSDLIREKYGVKVTFFIMLGLFFANLTTTIAEFAGIVASGEIFGISKYILVPLCAIFIIFFLVKSNYGTVEKMFLILILFYSAYIVSGFLANPDWGQVAKETVAPTIQFSSAYWVLLVAVVGTSVTPWMQFYLQSAIIEKGIKIEQFGITKFEIAFGSILTSVIALFIIVATGSTMFEKGIVVNSAKDVAIALQPLAGELASLVFAFGLFMAAFLGAWLVPLSTAYFITEGLGFESGINKSFNEAKEFYILIGVTLFLSAVVILIPNIDLIWIFIFAQVVNALLLPVIFYLVIKLSSNKKIMKEHANTKRYNFIANAILIALIIMSVILVVTPFL